MKISPYLSPSGYSQWDFCPMAFYMNYVLKWRGTSNKKADKGTIVHKALECLALAKVADQNGLNSAEDEDIGIIDTNKTMSRSTDYLDDILQRAYTFCSTKFKHHEWDESDYKQCKKWYWKALELNNGMFHPLSLNIISPELKFQFEIEEAWAAAKINDEECFFGLRGIIDLVVDHTEGVYEVIDWKTGKRIDWGSGKEKDLVYLKNDPQVRMYHLAMNKMYPDCHQVMVTIVFINSGGPFTICLTDEDLPDTRKMVERRFKEIIATDIPRLKKSWKCTKFCDFGTTSYEGTHVVPLIEWRDKQFTKPGEYMTMCQQTEFTLKTHGPEYTENNLKKYKND